MKVEVAPVPNKPTVSVDVKQHFNFQVQPILSVTFLLYLTDKPLTSRDLLIVKNQEDEDGMARDEHTEKDSTAADQPVVVTDKSKLEKKKKRGKNPCVSSKGQLLIE